MTLQDKKEQLAIEKNTFHPDSPAHEYFKRGFISGFDGADPIGFHDWAYINAHGTSIVGEYIYVDITGSYRYTTEELYLKFLEYKQTLKH